ncbi:MAG: hypothetical protein ABL888_19400 [Pirellulaceae bacterium]
MAQRKKSKTPTKRKMSEMISEMATGFLGVDGTIGERQNRLNAACNAWNMALGSPLVRQRQLQQYREGYLRFNPATSPSDLDNIIKDIEMLIERKLKLFPDDERQIVDAKVVKVGNNFRIEVASATLQ